MPALKMKEETLSLNVSVFYKMEKTSKQIFLGASKRNQPCWHFYLSPVKLISDLHKQNCKIECHCCFKPLSGNLLKEQEDADIHDIKTFEGEKLWLRCT